MIFIGVLTAVVIAASPADAEESDVGKAKETFDSALHLYRQAHYAEALAKFEEAYRYRPHPVIIYNIGRCYDQLGDLPKAMRSYRDYLRMSPDAPDRKQVTDAIGNLERRLAQKGVQQLVVYTEPAGAQVTIDGAPLGATPASIELPPGDHRVEVSKEGFDPISRSFAVPRNRSVELSFALTRQAPPADSVLPPLTQPAPTTPSAAPIANNPPVVRPTTREVEQTQPPSGAMRQWAWVPAAGGVVLAAVGGVFLYQAIHAHDELTSPTTTIGPAQAASYRQSGPTSQGLGIAFTTAGGLALVASGAMFLLGAPAPAHVAVGMGPGSVGVCAEGTF
jgi:hypothetical protein